MAVQSDTSRISYAGNNSTTTSYAVPFVFLENSHLKAIAKTGAGVESVVTLTNHTGAGDANGGTVRTAVAVPATSTLTIYRDVPITQTTTYAEGGDFPAASHERALDKLTQITQQIDRGLDRTLRFSEAFQLNEVNPPVSATPHVLTTVNGGAPTWETVPSVSTALNIPSLTDTSTVGASDELIVQQGGLPKRATGAELAKGLNQAAAAIVYTYYVAPAASGGNASNDGLSAAFPLTVAALRDKLLQAGPPLAGTYTVNVAAGTYSGAEDRNITFDSIQSVNPIVFEGPDVSGHPNVPTAVVSHSAGSGWHFRNGMNVTVKNIKFQNFTGGSGLVASFSTSLRCENVHTYNCLRGIWASTDCMLDVKGGIFDGNNVSDSFGIWSYNQCTHFIGSQTGDPLTDGPTIKQCTYGLYAAEHANGHANCAVEDCSRGYFIAGLSRVNADTSNFKNCAIGIAVETASVLVGKEDELDFNLGTGDACTATIWRKLGGVNSIEGTGSEVAVVEAATTSTTVTGTTSETHVRSYKWSRASVPRAFGGSVPARKVTITASGTKTGTAGAFSVIIRLHTSAATGGTQIGGRSSTVTNNGDWNFKMVCFLSGTGTQEAVSDITVNGQVTHISRRSTSYNLATGSDSFWNLNIIPADAGDSITVDMFSVEIS